MLPRLLILSDLWGTKKSEYLSLYTHQLQDYFEVHFYDCCDLGEIDTTIYTEENIHQQFIEKGIDKAIENLLNFEKKEVSILGFSIGGYIAWKSALKGLKINNLYAISSTRIRKENKKPDCNIQLYYGENDLYKPADEWLNTMKISAKIFKNENHEAYKSKKNAEVIIEHILNL